MENQHIINFISNKKTLLVLILIFLASLFLRGLFLDLIEYKTDEATTVYQTIQFFEAPKIIERGLISGIGVYNFPLFNFLMIILAIPSRDPQVLAFVMALLNSLLITVFYLVVRKYYNNLTAIFASLLMAFSPWSVLFSRKIWAQDLILLFMVPLLYFWHELVMKKNQKVILPIFILLALLIQLHGSGLFLTIVFSITLIVLRIKFNFKQAVVGFLLGFVLILPYIIFQFSATPFCPDCEAFTKYQQSDRPYDIYNFFRPAQIMGGLGFHFILGNDYNDFISLFPIVDKLKVIFLATPFILLSGLVFIITQKRQLIFILLFLTLMPVLYFISKTNAYMHYFVILIPILALLYGISFNYLLSRYSFLPVRIFVSSIFILILMANITYIICFYQYLSIKKDISGDYGPIYSLSESRVEQATSEYQNLPYYTKLKSYAYMAKPDKLHNKLSEFFLFRGEFDLSKYELSKVVNK